MIISDYSKYFLSLGPRSWLAHPHYDSEGNYFNISTAYVKRRNEIYKIPAAMNDEDTGTDGLEMISTFPCKDGVSYYHSFGMTENYFIFIQTSVFLGNPIGMLFMKLMDWTYADFLKFNPKVKSSFQLIERKTGKFCGRFVVEPFMCFHQVNAYEKDNSIIFDMCGYNDGSIFKGVCLDELRKGPGLESAADLRRYHLPLEKVDSKNPPTIQIEKNADGLDYDLIFQGFELPRINYEGNNGKEYSFTYGIGCSMTDLHKVGVHHCKSSTTSHKLMII